MSRTAAISIDSRPRASLVFANPGQPEPQSRQGIAGSEADRFLERRLRAPEVDERELYEAKDRMRAGELRIGSGRLSCGH